MSLLSVFVASLLGSAHCIGMCGGIVLLYSNNQDQRVKSHFSYNFGRLSSYVLLGALAGLLGASLNLASSAAGISNAASLVFGLLLLIWGALLLLKRRAIEPPMPGRGFIRKLFQALLSETSSTPLTLRAYLIGALSTLLPCGWLYMFAAVAAASGSPLWGMVVMIVFWLGTLPYLLAVGVASQHLLGRLRKHLPVLTGLLIMASGAFSISKHLYAADSVAVLSEQQRTEQSAEVCH